MHTLNNLRRSKSHASSFLLTAEIDCHIAKVTNLSDQGFYCGGGGVERLGEALDGYLIGYVHFKVEI